MVAGDGCWTWAACRASESCSDPPAGRTASLRLGTVQCRRRQWRRLGTVGSVTGGGGCRQWRPPGRFRMPPESRPAGPAAFWTQLQRLRRRSVCQISDSGSAGNLEQGHHVTQVPGTRRNSQGGRVVAAAVQLRLRALHLAARRKHGTGVWGPPHPRQL